MTWPRKGTKSQKVFCLCAFCAFSRLFFSPDLSSSKRTTDFTDFTDEGGNKRGLFSFELVAMAGDPFSTPFRA